MSSMPRTGLGCKTWKNMYFNMAVNINSLTCSTKPK
uniref:Uncharacterized protein n=1 Tax=Anguilla anguilla TaxID=7936 RepID=A0A0E9RMN1_ANGAN